MTKYELRQYRLRKIELKRLRGKIEETERELQCYNSDCVGRVTNLNKLKEHYERKKDELISKQYEAEKAISTLSDPVERALMGYYYIDALTWEAVCVEIDYSWRQTHYIHCKALQKLQDK